MFTRVAAATALGVVLLAGPAAAALAASPAATVVVPQLIGLDRARAGAQPRADGLRPAWTGAAAGRVVAPAPRHDDAMMVPVIAALVIGVGLLVEFGYDRRRRAARAGVVARPAPDTRTVVVPYAVLEQLERDKLSRLAGR